MMRGITALLCIAQFLISLSAFAQDAGELHECERLLSSPPISGLLTRNGGRDYTEFRSDRLGETLLGVRCSRAQIVSYFLNAGWKLRGESHHQPPAEAGPSSDRYKFDHSIGFEKYRSFPRSLLYGRRQAVAGVSMYQGRVTHIMSGPAK